MHIFLVSIGIAVVLWIAFAYWVAPHLSWDGLSEIDHDRQRVRLDLQPIVSTAVQQPPSQSLKS